MRKILLTIGFANLVACTSTPVMLKNYNNNYLITSCLELESDVSDQQNIIANVRVQYTNEYTEKVYYKYRVQDYFSLDSREQCINKANITAIKTEIDELRKTPDFESSDVIKLKVEVNFLDNLNIISTKSFVSEKNSEFASGAFNTFKKEKNNNIRISKLLDMAYQDIYNQIKIDLQKLKN